MRRADIFSFQFVRFLLVGVANTLVGLSIIYSAKYFFSLGDVLANAIGYGVGIVVSFMLNSRWTFRYSGLMLPAALKFLGAALVAYAANLLTVMAAIKGFGMNAYVAQALGTPAYTVTAYLISKYLVFRSGKK